MPRSGSTGTSSSICRWSVSAYDVPQVDVLLVSGSLRSDEDLYNLRHAARKAGRVVAIGTCAISGGVAHLGDCDEVRRLFLDQHERYHLPRLLPKSSPIELGVTVDRYLPGCPPTPELFIAALCEPAWLQDGSRAYARSAGARKEGNAPRPPGGFLKGDVQPDVCLINQGFLCIGTSTRGGCRAHLHPRRASLRGLPRAVGCLYREGVAGLVQCHPACLHRHDRYPARGDRSDFAFPAAVDVPVPVLGLQRATAWRGAKNRPGSRRSCCRMTILVFPSAGSKGTGG